MEDGSVIEIQLYAKTAPNTVRNFISLANEGFYDGVIFHRIIPGFMIQGGDPEGSGMGGPGYSIRGEFSSNGIENTLKHERGVISMARSQENDSAGSQFFIMHQAAPHLDGLYAGFGKVISGIENVDKIVEVERDKSDRPLTEQRIQSIKVDTKGVTFEAPNRM
ncbi:peptidylprolyl isomerase [Erysipelothrix sp. HDW6A]|uniref:peptidylprolyl isomerase n=1 Tax=Erysipelothrix sp. HDW6A TaxID=2714928 RepID=UPI001F0D990C|nr:peptidylprolyl isomerase [Erysipelothrix sp. HDW6A]